MTGTGSPKYCKVTVRRASPPPAKPRPRRQTVGADVEANFTMYRPQYGFIDDDTGDIAVLAEEAPPPPRRRAATTTSGGVEMRKGRVLNPLSRMTLRWTEHEKPAATAASTAASSSTAVSSTASGGSSTPEMPDTPPPILDFGMAGDLTSSFLDVDTDGHDPPARATLDDASKFFMAGTPPIPAGLTLDMLPTQDNTPPIPSHLLDSIRVTNRTFEPMPFMGDEAADESEYETESELDDDASSAATSDYLDTLEHPVASVDIDSIMQSRAEAIARFEASMNSASRAKPAFRTTDMPAQVARDLRGLSSPPRMMSTVIRQRKGTVANGPLLHSGGSDSTAEPLFHGQELHLCFKTSTGQLTQVAGHPKRRGPAKNPFSRRIRCHAIDDESPLEDLDTLRVIGHTTDGLLRGGDCISLARTDGSVLRTQKISKKLTFSAKIDVRAKFIITGVPERTVVTTATKFYLQSVYDRSKTVGYLRSHRAHHPGCLAVYATGGKEDKVEPTQFFKRESRVGQFHGVF